jgi:hypothetical protein
MTPADTSSRHLCRFWGMHWQPALVMTACIGDDCLRLGHGNDNSDLLYSQQLQLLEAQNPELVRQNRRLGSATGDKDNAVVTWMNSCINAHGESQLENSSRRNSRHEKTTAPRTKYSLEDTPRPHIKVPPTQQPYKETYRHEYIRQKGRQMDR